MRVLIAEDLQPMRQHAAQIVRTCFGDDVQITEVDNGADALKQEEIINPDLMLLDISMPEMSGVQVAGKVWARTPNRKILFWSQYSREAHVRELGKIVPDQAIHGYILKSESDDVMMHALRSIVNLDNPYITAKVRVINSKLTSKDASLSDIEYATLMDLVMGLTDKAIASRHKISVRGAQNRIAILFSKLLGEEPDYYKELAGMEVFSPRTRAAFVSYRRGLLDPDNLETLETELRSWLAEEFE